MQLNLHITIIFVATDGDEPVNFGDEEEIDSTDFKIIKVDKDCELAKRVEDEGFTYRRGCAYYEFSRNAEWITRDKIIIFQKKDTVRFLILFFYLVYSV